MTDLTTKLSEELHALIQSSPRSPTKEEISKVLRVGLKAPVDGDILVMFSSDYATQKANSSETLPFCIKCGNHHHTTDACARNDPSADRAPHPYDRHATVDGHGNLYDEHGKCLGWAGITAPEARLALKREGLRSGIDAGDPVVRVADGWVRWPAESVHPVPHCFACHAEHPVAAPCRPQGSAEF
jgi:hypothetical protein